MPRRPNILLVIADQMRHDCLGVLNPAIRTPNLDRLAAAGMLFTRAYPPTPVCLPCRAGMLSGQYCSTNRAMHNMSSLPEDHEPSLGTAFNSRGYYTHFIGKSHLSSCHDPLSREAAPHIHNREFFRRWHGPWYGFSWADIAIGHSVEEHACGMHYGAWLDDQGVDIERHFGNHAYDAFGAWDLPEEYHNSKWTADVAIAGIDRARKLGQPFLLDVNFQDPHNPCLVPEPWASMYDPERIPTFGYKPGEPECFADKPAFYARVTDQPGPYAARNSDEGLAGSGNLAHLAYTPEDTQRNAATYYGMVSLLDHHLGRILDHLEACGEADDTLVVFTADHGDILGDHGFWYKSLVAYEESIHVPLIAAFPGHIPAGTRSPAFQNLIDLFPTCCAYAGIPIPEGCEGVDQRSAWADPAARVREQVVIEERPADSHWCQRILIDDRYKLVFYSTGGPGELYEVAADPHHVRNLWDDPAHQDVKHAMLERLLRHEITKTQPRPGPSAAQRLRLENP